MADIPASENQYPFVTLAEQEAAPATPAAGLHKLYALDGKFYRKNSSGTQTELGGGGGGGSSVREVITVTANTYNVLPENSGCIFACSNEAYVDLVLPSDAPVGTWFDAIQTGDGLVWVYTPSGPEAMIVEADKTVSTRALGCKVMACVVSNADDVSAIWSLTGDLADMAPPGPPEMVVPPSIVGTFEVGEEVACNAGSWASEELPTYSYVWKLNGSTVGTDSQTFVNTGAGSLVCELAVTNSFGTSNATTDAVTIV